ncbi:hypothetical protein TNCT_173751 [Trichonephila clavata]|uniref:Uncharacterized protein n=1 Tax=Trichonephila clavata TaxID=2740835 RepID=A0A8X6HC92_TRICU|nr:hypothetical protein TNCT_173751 [Trichonephila clavata]
MKNFHSTKDQLRAENAELETEQQTFLGEIELISCPIVNCPTHTFKTDQNVRTQLDLNNKSTTNENKAKDNPKLKNHDKDDPIVKSNENVKTRNKIK